MMNSGMGQTGTTSSAAPAGKSQRVYEVARELGVENKEFLSKSRALGIDAKNHMSMLTPDDVARVKRAFDKDRQDTLIEERVASTVIRRRSRTGGAAPAPNPAGSASLAQSAASAQSRTSALPKEVAKAEAAEAEHVRE